MYDHKIAVLLPYDELLGFAQQLADHMGIQIHAEKIDSTNAIQVAQRACQNGASVIISRGNLAKKIRKNVNVDVVSVMFSEFEYLQAINKYRDTNYKIAVIENSGIIEGIRRLNQFFEMDIHYYLVNNVEEFTDKTIEAINEGNKIIVGGSWGIEIQEFLRSVNVKYEMIKSTKPSIETSIKNAVALIHSNRRKQTDQQILRNILTFAQNGIVIVNSRDNIVTINPVAGAILNIASEQAVGKKSSVFLPMLTTAETLDKKCIQTNQHIIWKGKRYEIDKIPVFVDGNVESVIVFIKPDSYQQIASHTAGLGTRPVVSFSRLYGQNSQAAHIERLSWIIARQSPMLLVTGEDGSGKKVLAQSIHLQHNQDLSNFIEIDCSFGNQILSNFFGGIENVTLNNDSLILPTKNGTLYLKNFDMLGEKEEKLVNILVNKLIHFSAQHNELKIILSSKKNSLKDARTNSPILSTLINACGIINISIPPFHQMCEEKTEVLQAIVAEQEQNVSLCRGIFRQALEHAEGYLWPGNIYEFRMFVQLVVNMHRDNVASEDIIEIIGGHFKNQSPLAQPAPTYNLKDREQQAITEALEFCAHNKSRAAQLLGIDRSTLLRKLKKYE